MVAQVPVFVKVRLLDTIEDSIDLVQGLAAAVPPAFTICADGLYKAPRSTLDLAKAKAALEEAKTAEGDCGRLGESLKFP